MTGSRRTLCLYGFRYNCTLSCNRRRSKLDHVLSILRCSCISQRHHFFIGLFMAIALHTKGVRCLFSVIPRVFYTYTSLWFRVASSPSGCLRETAWRFLIYFMDDHDPIGPLHRNVLRFLVGTTIPKYLNQPILNDS